MIATVSKVEVEFKIVDFEQTKEVVASIGFGRLPTDET